MAVEDHPLFEKWDAATKKWRARQEFYEALKMYEDDYPLKQEAKKAVAEAAKEAADIVSEL